MITRLGTPKPVSLPEPLLGARSLRPGSALQISGMLGQRTPGSPSCVQLLQRPQELRTWEETESGSDPRQIPWSLWG